MRAAQELRRQDHSAKVVFLSVQQDEEFVAAAFESGGNCLRLQIQDAFRSGVGHRPRTRRRSVCFAGRGTIEK
jgi:hypothetical protein